VLHLFGEVSEGMAEYAIKGVIEDGERVITLCTKGGDVNAALAIYDAIKGQGVTVIGTGTVASAGITILLGGDKRYATANTRLMTHEITMCCDDEDQLSKEDLEETIKLTGILTSIIGERTGMAEIPAKAMMKSENNFGLKEAIEMGFVEGEWNWKGTVRDRAGF
jgi:ATP-dependent protease ClpP protease subunit